MCVQAVGRLVLLHCDAKFACGLECHRLRASLHGMLQGLCVSNSALDRMRQSPSTGLKARLARNICADMDNIQSPALKSM